MRALMRSLAPSSFEDVAALVALYRPGPMAANMHNDYADRKNGRKPVEYFHPDAEEVLADTYGLMIYQELIMRVAQRFAGYSLAQADSLRKAMGKKSREVMAKEKEAFVAGVRGHRLRRRPGHLAVHHIEQFADYAFNKSHSFGYGYIAYQTAYLKAHHPAEYLSALLTSVKANLDKAAIYLAECRTMGIEVLVPDVNRSVSDFTPVIEIDAGRRHRAASIVFGLSAVRNVGVGLVGLLLAEREANGPFVDFYDFVERVDFQVLNKKTLESLIKAGGFDSLGHPRQGLLRAFEHIVDSTVARRRERDMGVMSLFGEIEDAGPMFDERPPIPEVEFAKRERLSFEKEMLGLYVSDHPLMGAEASLRAAAATARLADLAEIDDGTIRTFGGVITGLQRKWTKKGDLMAVFMLEDLQTVGRGDGLPEDDERSRPQARGRRRRRREGPRGRSGRSTQAHRHGHRALRADVGGGVPPAAEGGSGGAVRAAHRGPQAAARGSTPATHRCSCTSGRSRCCGCLRRGPSTSSPPCWPRCACCSDPARSSADARLDPRVTIAEQARRADAKRSRVAPSGRVYWTGRAEPRVIRGLESECRSRSRPRTALHWVTPSWPSWPISALKDRSPTRSGLLSKQAEAWVLITQATDNGKLKGFAFSTLERIGGTPSVLIGLASVKRTAKRDTVLRAIVHDQLRRAVLAFPDEDVLFGTRFATAGGFEAFRTLNDVVPRPDHRASGEERAWGRRLAKRFGVEASAYDDRSFLATGTGSHPEVFDHDTLKPEAMPADVSAFFAGVTPDRGDSLVAFGWAMAEDLAKLA